MDFNEIKISEDKNFLEKDTNFEFRLNEVSVGSLFYLIFLVEMSLFFVCT